MLKPNINKIYNIDFRDGFSKFDLSDVKLFVTDPPYNIGFSYDGYDDNLSDEDYIKLLCNFQQLPLAIIHYPEETIKWISPALGVPDEIIVWCYNSNIGRQSRLINFYNIKPDFKKIKQAYKNPTDKRVQKLIKNGSEGTRLYDWFSDIQLVKNVSKEKAGHPCPVPVKLIERIILLTTNEKDLVCDPFMGSGTTAKAAKNTNRNYIGFEQSKKYCQDAKIKIE